MISRLSQGSFCIAEHYILFKDSFYFVCFFKDFFLTGKERNRNTPLQMPTRASSREFVRIFERNDTASGATVTKVGKALLVRKNRNQNQVVPKL